jgi:hypothetical protein
MTLTQHINAIRHKLTGDLSQAEIEDLSSLRSAIGGRLSRGTGLKLRPCPKCGKLCGAREMRKHKCFDNTTVVRKHAPNPCPKGCGQTFSGRAMRDHLKSCDGRVLLGPGYWGVNNDGTYTYSPINKPNN